MSLTPLQDAVLRRHISSTLGTADWEFRQGLDAAEPAFPATFSHTFEVEDEQGNISQYTMAATLTAVVPTPQPSANTTPTQS